MVPLFAGGGRAGDSVGAELAGRMLNILTLGAAKQGRQTLIDQNWSAFGNIVSMAADLDSEMFCQIGKFLPDADPILAM